VVSEYSAPTAILSIARKKRHARSRGAQALKCYRGFFFLGARRDFADF
jgi:hypothetical protein